MVWQDLHANCQRSSCHWARIIAAEWPCLSPLPMLLTAMDNGVIMYCLLSHTTRVLQPIDVALFSPLKKKGKNPPGTQTPNKGCKGIDRATFPLLLKELWKRMKPEHIVAGSERLGFTHSIHKQSLKKSCNHLFHSILDQGVLRERQPVWRNAKVLHQDVAVETLGKLQWQFE